MLEVTTISTDRPAPWITAPIQVAGARVTFTNHDQTAHTATAGNSGFDTGTVNPGE